ncbi:MAG: carboxypeptidase-like regulatory domain-containing protein [Chitinophagales bacterium]|nr:carboxypeptidase-like regulatory domain-containing protein [Chitinophagales bacterium]
MIQISGKILSNDLNSTAVGYVSVINKSRNSSTYSNASGNYAVVAAPNDTILFRCIGFKTLTFIVPNQIEHDFIKVNQVMTIENTELPSVVIVPWKTIEDFQKELINKKLKQDDLMQAYQNLQASKWEHIRSSTPTDGQEGQRLAMQNYLQQNYGAAHNNLLNPFAWMQFFDYLGKNKKKKEKSNIDYYLAEPSESDK